MSTESLINNLPSDKPKSKKGLYIGIVIALLFVGICIILAVVLTRKKKCSDGQELVGTKCLVKCADGEVRNGEICECKPDYEKIGTKCLIKCADNQIRDGEICKDKPVKCADDQELVGTKCLVKCDGNQDRVGERCLVKCADGVVRNGEICECKDKYNIFQYNGKDVICPPNYNFGTLEQRYGKGKSYNLWNANDVCWMSEDIADCFNGTCDPSKYLINGKPFVSMGGADPRGKGLMNGTFSGTYLMNKYSNKTNSLYMTSAMPFTDSLCYK